MTIGTGPISLRTTMICTTSSSIAISGCVSRTHQASTPSLFFFGGVQVSGMCDKLFKTTEEDLGFSDKKKAKMLRACAK